MIFVEDMSNLAFQGTTVIFVMYMGSRYAREETRQGSSCKMIAKENKKSLRAARSTSGTASAWMTTPGSFLANRDARRLGSLLLSQLSSLGTLLGNAG